MHGLLPYAWRGLRARPVRTALSTFGIALGVAVLVASLAVSAGLDASIDRSVASLTGRADLRVTAFTSAGLGPGSLAAIDATPGVAVTAPAIERRTFLAPSAGAGTAVREPVMVLGIDPMRETRVRDLVLARGEPLGGPDQGIALVTERLARDERLDLGSELAIMGGGDPVVVRVIGILSGDGPVTGAAGRAVVLPIATAARLLPAPDEAGAPANGDALRGVTRVDIVLAAGADAAMVTGSLEAALTSEPYVLSIPRDTAEAMRASTADIRATMALLAAVTLFAAAFLVLNTLSMTVIERVRELALLRAAGAARGQVIRIVLAQAIALGLAGATLGLAGGVLLSEGVAAWLRAAGVVQLDGPAMTPGVIVAGLLLGTAIAVVSAIEPARRAAGVSPVMALRARSDPATAIRARAGWLVTVVVMVGLVALVLAPVGTEGLVTLQPVAAYAVLLLAVLLTPAILGPAVRLAGLPFAAALRLEERLARAAIIRDPSRTSITLGALIVGLAMVVALGSMAENARRSATAWIADVVPGDELLTAIVPVPLDGDLERDLEAVPGVTRASPLATFDLAFRGARLEAVAVRGADLAADGRLSFVAGDRAGALTELDAGGVVLVPESRAARLGVGLGDELAVITTGGLVELRVAGIIRRSIPGSSGEAVLVGWADASDRLGVAGASVIAVRYAQDAAPAASATVHRLAGELALTPVPVSRVEGAVSDALDRVFGLLDLLAVAAVIVAALGIVNTLSMDVWERTRELGMLRAAGMSRRQVWRSVMVEAGMLGLVGGLVGAAAGIVIGMLAIVAGGGRIDAGLMIPWASIVVALAMGIVLAMLAAAHPARIAGSRPIAAAVRSE